MDLQLAGKRAIITGASRGIGYAVTAALAAEGADLVLVARDQAALDAAAARLARPGLRVLAIAADTTDDRAVRAMVARTVTELGGADILVNAAAQPGGAGTPRGLAALADDDLRAEIETKVLGYLRCARAVAPHMSAQGWGRIINISGLAARQTGSVFGSIRNVAVAAMTKNLADELGPARPGRSGGGAPRDQRSRRGGQHGGGDQHRPHGHRRRGGRRGRLPGLAAQ